MALRLLLRQSLTPIPTHKPCVGIFCKNPNLSLCDLNGQWTIDNGQLWYFSSKNDLKYGFLFKIIALEIHSLSIVHCQLSIS